jgi:phosphate transport system permease protein
MTETSFDPFAPLIASGNLRRRRAFSRIAELGATGAAFFAVAVLAIVIYSVAARGASALSFEFLVTGAPTGIAPALVGTGLIVAVATAIAMPLGVLAALFLTEFAGERMIRLSKLTLDLINGLPSIIIGLFVFGLLVDHHKQSGYAGSVALAIIMLPLVARGTQEVLLLVPGNLREGADALGVSRWRTVLTVILPSALGGILTATMLAVARAAGETAPLILVSSVFDGKEVLFKMSEAMPNVPVRIFQLSEEGNPEGIAQAWGMSLVLITLILLASVGARAMHARSRRKMTS